MPFKIKQIEKNGFGSELTATFGNFSTIAEAEKRMLDEIDDHIFAMVQLSEDRPDQIVFLPNIFQIVDDSGLVILEKTISEDDLDKSEKALFF